MPQHRHRGRHRRPVPRRRPAHRTLVPAATAASLAASLAVVSMHGAGPAERPAAATKPVPLPAFTPAPLVQPLDDPSQSPRPAAAPMFRWRATRWTPPPMPARPLSRPQRRAYATVAREADGRIRDCGLTGPILATVMYVDHATHSARARAALPTALALCGRGTHLGQAGALTLALYRYAGSGAYVRVVLAIADEYDPA